MQTAISRRSFLTRGAAGASLLCVPSAVFAKYEAESDANSNEVILRFSALSDVHFKKDPACVEADRFRRSMQFMYDYSSKQSYKNFDAMLVAGDVSDHGWDEELLLFKKIMDEGIKEGTETIVCMGNHEFIAGNKPRWEEIFERPANKVYDVKGFKFVALSPEKGTCRDGDFLYALDWFDKSISEACANSDKPVFTFQHYHVTPTVYGSRGEDNWGTKDLYETLQKYPKVIDFSGHSHYPINDPRSIWQGRFTALGTGTLSYFEMGGEGGKYNKFPQGFHDAAQLYVVEVRKDNTVCIKPYDLITNTFFDVVYLINPGAIGEYAYTDERYKTSVAPAWAADAKAACTKLEADYAVVEFPQATCPDVVHSYRLEIEKQVEGQWESMPAQYFWSEYYFQNQPNTMSVELDLEPESQYRIKAVALNPFFKESEKNLSLEITTPKDEDAPADQNAAAPQANMLDVRFENGKVVSAIETNKKAPNALETFGAPQIVKETALGGAFVAAFNGKDTRYKMQFNKRAYAKLGKATIAAKFKTDKFAEENQSVIANTQGAGVAIEVNGGKKTIEFWANVNGTYQIISAPIQAGEYIDAFGTFNGKVMILYLNGKEVARKEAAGRLVHPSEESVQAFCVGSDIAPGGSGSNFFEGKIARARVYSWALTAEQVANLSK